MNESMNSPADTGSGSGTASDTSGFGLSLGRVAEVFHAPVAMFQNMASRWGWTDWVVPILVVIIGSVGLSVYVIPHLDLVADTRASLEASGLGPDQIEQQVSQQRALFEGPFGAVIAFIPVITVPATLLILALIFWGSASIMGGRITFGRMFSVFGYAWMPKLAEGLLLVFVIQGREDIRPSRVPSLLVTNPASFLDPSAAGTPLYALLASFNPFTLWTMLLVALGLAGMGKMSRGSAYMVVGGLYAAWILVQLGWSALF